MKEYTFTDYIADMFRVLLGVETKFDALQADERKRKIIDIGEYRQNHAD